MLTNSKIVPLLDISLIFNKAGSGDSAANVYRRKVKTKAEETENCGNQRREPLPFNLCIYVFVCNIMSNQALFFSIVISALKWAHIKRRFTYDNQLL